MSEGVEFPCHVELYCDAVDLRKGHHGLLGIVEQELGKDGLNGSLYLFSNRNRSLIKGLYWDRTGYVVISKRLESGKFCIPFKEDVIELDNKSLRLLLDGLKLFV